MNKPLSWFLLIMISLLCTGCFQTNTQMTIQSNGSIQYGGKLLVPKLFYEKLEKQIPEISTAKASGLKVEEIEEDGKKGYQIYKNYENLESLKKDTAFTKAGYPFDTFSPKQIGEHLKIRKGTFIESYSLEHKISLGSILSEKHTQVLESLPIQSPFQIRFILTLPIEADDHNADEVTNGGHTLIWNLIPGSEKEIQVEASSFNTIILGLIIGVGIFLLFLLGYVFWRKRKRKLA